MGLLQLTLREKRQQMLVAAMAIDDDDLLTAIARHLVRGLLQERQLQLRAVGNRPGFVLRLKYLPKEILRKDYGIFLLGSLDRRITYIQQIRTERKVGSMLFQNAERQQTSTLRLLDGIAEIARGQFLPVHGQLRLGPANQT